MGVTRTSPVTCNFPAFRVSVQQGFITSYDAVAALESEHRHLEVRSVIGKDGRSDPLLLSEETYATLYFDCRLTQRRPDIFVSHDFPYAIQRPRASFPDGDWLHAAADAVRLLGVDAIVLSAPDLFYPGYITPPPWELPPLTSVTPSSPRPRDAHVLVLSHLTSPGVTNGSLFPEGRAEAAAVTGSLTLLWRLPKVSTILFILSSLSPVISGILCLTLFFHLHTT